LITHNTHQKKSVFTTLSLSSKKNNNTPQCSKAPLTASYIGVAKFACRCAYGDADSARGDPPMQVVMDATNAVGSDYWRRGAFGVGLACVVKAVAATPFGRGVAGAPWRLLEFVGSLSRLVPSLVRAATARRLVAAEPQQRRA
jgi:hypothetical protein